MPRGFFMGGEGWPSGVHAPGPRARSRWLCGLQVSLRGAAESAGCTSAARDAPEDDINQPSPPDFGSRPALTAVLAPWEINSAGSPLLTGGLHPDPRGFWGRGTDAPDSSCVGRVGMLEPPGDGPRGGIRAPNPPCDAQGRGIRCDGGFGWGYPHPLLQNPWGMGVLCCSAVLSGFWIWELEEATVIGRITH